MIVDQVPSRNKLPMTNDELKQYKQDYNAKISELKKQYRIKQLMILDIENEQDEIMTNLFEAIDDHGKVCEEFDRGKE